MLVNYIIYMDALHSEQAGTTLTLQFAVLASPAHYSKVRRDKDAPDQLGRQTLLQANEQRWQTRSNAVRRRQRECSAVRHAMLGGTLAAAYRPARALWRRSRLRFHHVAQACAAVAARVPAGRAGGTHSDQASGARSQRRVAARHRP